jgi:glycine cleavage system H lipoate-binding protein
MKETGLMVPAIMITGYPTIKTALRALRLGATDYLAKPFTRKELLGPVARALRRAHGGAIQNVRDTMVPPEMRDDHEEPDVDLAPGDRVHLRRHSWAVYCEDGSVEVGIGASFLATIGTIDSIELPSEADLVEQGYVAFRLRTRGGEEHGVFMPLSGRVLKANEEALEDPSRITAETWLIRLAPDRLENELSLLVRG